jgi:ABC-type multidrug transport system ATPase subunit
MAEAAISLRGVSKHFGAKVAVNDVSFDVLEGQCYGLIGPNGAGKTTTFSMMCGFLFPTAGSLKVMGVTPTEPGALKKKVHLAGRSAAHLVRQPLAAAERRSRGEGAARARLAE